MEQAQVKQHGLTYLTSLDLETKAGCIRFIYLNDKSSDCSDPIEEWEVHQPVVVSEHPIAEAQKAWSQLDTSNHKSYAAFDETGKFRGRCGHAYGHILDINDLLAS